VVIPKIFTRYLGISSAGSGYVFVVAVFALVVGVTYLKKKQRLLVPFFVMVIIGMNVLLPFHPNRNDFIKKIGNDISLVNSNEPVEVYLIKNPAHFSLGMILPFYLPLGSQVDNISDAGVIFDNYEYNNTHLCYVENNLIKKEISNRSILTYVDGAVFACIVSEK
jgi:hypothetical protein